MGTIGMRKEYNRFLMKRLQEKKITISMLNVSSSLELELSLDYVDVNLQSTYIKIKNKVGLPKLMANPTWR